MEMDEVWKIYDVALSQPVGDAGQWDDLDEHINVTDVWETVEEAWTRMLA